MSTKAEIIEILKGQGIEHDPASSKSELEALLPEAAVPVESDEEILAPDNSDSEEKARVKKVYVLFKKQFPAQWETRREELLGRLSVL